MPAKKPYEAAIETMLIGGATSSQLNEADLGKRRIKQILQADRDAKIAYAIIGTGMGMAERAMVIYNKLALEPAVSAEKETAKTESGPRKVVRHSDSEKVLE